MVLSQKKFRSLLVKPNTKQQNPVHRTEMEHTMKNLSIPCSKNVLTTTGTMNEVIETIIQGNKHSLRCCHIENAINLLRS